MIPTAALGVLYLYPNTLILTFAASIIGVILGMGLAMAGISKTRLASARVRGDISE